MILRELTRNSELGIYINLKSIKYLPAKGISLINFVNSQSQVQAKIVGIIWIHTVWKPTCIPERHIFRK